MNHICWVLNFYFLLVILEYQFFSLKTLLKIFWIFSKSVLFLWSRKLLFFEQNPLDSIFFTQMYYNNKSFFLYFSCAARVGYVIDPYQRMGISDVYLPEHCPVYLRYNLEFDEFDDLIFFHLMMIFQSSAPSFTSSVMWSVSVTSTRDTTERIISKFTTRRCSRPNGLNMTSWIMDFLAISGKNKPPN